MAFLLYLILRIAAQAAFVEEFFFGEAEVRLAASAGWPGLSPIIFCLNSRHLALEVIVCSVWIRWLSVRGLSFFIALVKSV